MVSAHSQSTLLDLGPRADLLKTARAKIRSGCFSAIFIELCCEKDSALSHGVNSGVIAIRVTADCELTLNIWSRVFGLRSFIEADWYFSQS